MSNGNGNSNCQILSVIFQKSNVTCLCIDQVLFRPILGKLGNKSGYQESSSAMLGKLEVRPKKEPSPIFDWKIRKQIWILRKFFKKIWKINLQQGEYRVICLKVGRQSFAIGIFLLPQYAVFRRYFSFCWWFYANNPTVSHSRHVSDNICKKTSSPAFLSKQNRPSVGCFKNTFFYHLGESNLSEKERCQVFLRKVNCGVSNSRARATGTKNLPRNWLNLNFEDIFPISLRLRNA